MGDSFYGLSCIIENKEPLDFYLRGTLSSLKSIFDYLMEDYANEYSLKLNRKCNENLQDTFVRIARETDNKDALTFIKFYGKERNKLFENKEVRFLLGYDGVRNLDLHGRPKFKILWVDGEAAYRRDHKIPKDQPVDRWEVIFHPYKPQDEKYPFSYFTFEGYENEDGQTICYVTCKKVSSFLELIRETFPTCDSKFWRESVKTKNRPHVPKVDTEKN